MSGQSSRLARIESELAAERLQRAQVIGIRLCDFLETCPPAEEAAFWRATRQALSDTDTSPRFLEICGGTFEVSAADEAIAVAIAQRFVADPGQR